MAKVQYDWIVNMQEAWKSLDLASWEKDEMIALSNKLMHKFIDNNHEVHGVSLLYPEECSNYDVFINVACGLRGVFTEREDGGRIATDFVLGEID